MPKKTLGSLWIDALPTRWGFETRLNLIWLQSVQSKIKPANNVDSMTRRKIENFLIDLQKITRVNILTPLHFGCRVLNFGIEYGSSNWKKVSDTQLGWCIKHTYLTSRSSNGFQLTQLKALPYYWIISNMSVERFSFYNPKYELKGP